MAVRKTSVPVKSETVIRGRGITVGFGERKILENLDIDVYRGEILGIVGASGTGKSVLLRTILGLQAKTAGSVEILGQPYDDAEPAIRAKIDQRLGVLFQQGALFSSLSVLQNVEFPIREHLKLSPRLMEELARLKIDLVGLAPEAADRLPSELSGGMIKRASLARALALDPDIVFLDEPTSGLDPISAGDFDQLVMTLQRTLGLTVFMVTHDLDSLKTACNRIAVLGDRKVLLVGTMDDMLASQHPWLRAYFHGKRARAVVA